ncbi:MAG: hypothetical protein R3C01_16080 [Planctomycetaceae bacterium]
MSHEQQQNVPSSTDGNVNGTHRGPTVHPREAGRDRLSTIIPLSTPLPPETRPVKRFRAVLEEFVFAQKGHIARFSVPLITEIGMKLLRRFPPFRQESEVVERLSPWERYLCHLPRNHRCMNTMLLTPTLQVTGEEPLARIIAAVTREVARTFHGDHLLQNQPLDVLLDLSSRRRVLDPRVSLNGQIVLGIRRADGEVERLTIDLNHPILHAALEQPAASTATDTPSVTESWTQEIERLLATLISPDDQSGTGQRNTTPMSIIIDRAPVDASQFSASLSSFPGAWLRISPLPSSQGFQIAGDHLVLDGAFCNHLALSILRSLPLADTISINAGRSTIPTSSQLPVLMLEIESLQRLTPLLMCLSQTLDAFGFRTQSGDDVVMLTTVPRQGPHVDADIPAAGHRILPVLLRFDQLHHEEDLRERIESLNQHGWCSAMPTYMNEVYSPHISPLLRLYSRYISPRLPFLGHTTRQLSGTSLITVPPPLTVSSAAYDRLNAITADTVRPMLGGPVFHVNQVVDYESGRRKAFVSLSGSGPFNTLPRLTAMRDHLRHLLEANPSLQ